MTANFTEVARLGKASAPGLTVRTSIARTAGCVRSVEGAE